MRPPIPQVTLEQFEQDYSDRHLIHAAADYWAARQPDRPAVVNATRGTELSWRELQQGSVALAAALSRMGLGKGDFLAASLPLSNEHILLEYACFRLGVIHAPLDLRLQPEEVLRSINLIGARAYLFFDKLAALSEVVRAKCRSVEHLMPFGAAECAALLAKGAEPAEPAAISESDGAQVIFTTGSTGSPKAALLTHRSITAQNLALGTGFGFGPDQRVLCNLPASHVGGQAEVLMTSLFMGGTAITLEIFDPALSLAAIEQHKVTLIGQIPAMFQMEWRAAEYGKRDLASLQKAVYGGQAVPRPFLDQMLAMAPCIATGLGLTETSGFCTYTPVTGDADQVARSIGWSMPLYPMSIRGDMQRDGTAGPELESGTVGPVCFRGPQTFAGYVNDPEATARTIAKDGWLYTGDMGSLDADGLHFAGRAKFVLKPSGYQVFPGDIEAHFARLTDKVASAGVVGHEHRLWSEGIIAFIEKRPGADLTEAELKKHARGLTAYMRPLHYVILEPGAMPLNRTAKVDVIRLQELATEEVRRLRERGRWDRAAVRGETTRPANEQSHDTEVS